MRGSLSTSRIRLARMTAAASLFLLPAGSARAQCDPDVKWDIFRPTGDVAEIVVDGNVAWIGAQGGVVRVDLASLEAGNPVQSKITDLNGLVSTDITALARDSFGNLWVGTRHQGVSIFDAQGHHLRDLSAFDEDPLWSDNVLAIGGQGGRMAVVSADEFSPQGNPEGGGFQLLNVTSSGSGFTFRADPGIHPELEVGSDVLVQGPRYWFGTGGQGLWLWDESVVPASFRQVLTSGDGLLSTNVKKIVEAPHFPSGSSVLWLGTGLGLQTYDPASESLETIAPFTGHNILDLYMRGNVMYVLSDIAGSRDLYMLDLASTPVAVRVPRSECFGDTLYVPRQVAVDGSGRIVLGTRSNGYSVRVGLDWKCPPPLGPHHSQVADLALRPDGTLYFGTGDKERNLIGNGVGVYDGTDWTSITRDQGIVHPNMTEVLVWRDGTVWFGTSQDANAGGLNRYFPDIPGASLETYHNAVQIPERRTLGRHVRSLEMDRAGNLWVVYGQANPSGGLSVIEAPPSLLVKNYDFSLMGFAGIKLLRDLAFDSRDRIWVCTSTTTDQPARLYIVDPRGTIADLTDDRLADYSMPTEVFDLGECKDIEIDSQDRVWIAGEKGLALGQIVADVAGRATATWTRIIPSATQAAGRNPLPYEVARLDWEENLWLGTESSGLLRISKDLSTWTWFDQLAGCPLPDQAIRGLFIDKTARQVWVGTATGGIARMDLSAARSPGTGEGINPQPYPNPWNPQQDGVLRFSGIPPDQTIDLRVWTLGGELVSEQLGVRGEKRWDGTNLGGNLVESGMYVVTGRAASGATYEGKVAVVR